MPVPSGTDGLYQLCNLLLQLPEESPVKKYDDVPPPPPTRVTSLPEYRRNLPVVSPTESDEGEGTDNIDDELAALIDDDDERPPELPPKTGSPTDFELSPTLQ